MSRHDGRASSHWAQLDRMVNRGLVGSRHDLSRPGSCSNPDDTNRRTTADVAGHVIKPITVRRKFRHRDNPGVAIFAAVFYRKFSLPGVGHPFPVRTKIVAPGVSFAG